MLWTWEWYEDIQHINLYHDQILNINFPSTIGIPVVGADNIGFPRGYLRRDLRNERSFQNLYTNLLPADTDP